MGLFLTAATTSIPCLQKVFYS